VTRPTYSRLFASQQQNGLDRSTLSALSDVLADDDAPLAARDDSRIPAGYTYFGQFIAHDVSFDDTKGLPLTTLDPTEVRNARPNGLGLTSVYGNGPAEWHQELFQNDSIRLRQGPASSSAGIVGYDLPRLETGEALIADERNDETVAIAQLHACFITFHNRVADHLAKANGGRVSFDMVRTTVVQHFHSVILHDYLWRLIPTEIYLDVMNNGRRLYYPDGIRQGECLQLPVEFSHAAFRFGHAMIRAHYRWNRTIAVTPFEDLPKQTKRNGPPDFVSLHPDWIIDWRNFLDFSPLAGLKARRTLNFARKIDVSVSTALRNLPRGERQHGEPANLPARDLIRGQALLLPSGQDAVQELRDRFDIYAPQLGAGDFERIHNERMKALLTDAALSRHTPLWLYVLTEAELLSHGECLGPLGGRIVMEVLHALIDASVVSILREKDWRPTVPSHHRDFFTLPDLVAFSGMKYDM
jgi:hypothetical protein